MIDNSITEMSLCIVYISVSLSGISVSCLNLQWISKEKHLEISKWKHCGSCKSSQADIVVCDRNEWNKSFGLQPN